MAEDVEPIVPEIVQTFDDGLKGISYGNLAALLIEAIKKQEIKINALEEIISKCCTAPNQDQGNKENGKQKNEIQANAERNLNNQPNNDTPILYQNVPNPFNEKTKIHYFLPEDSFGSSILIFDMQGKLLKTFNLINKGYSFIEISGNELKPGMYMYTLISTRKRN